VSCSEELKKEKDAALAPPSREAMKGVLDTVEGQLGYRLGWHHAMDNAIEIAEEEEDS
jgi:hypothetical protein